MNDNYLDQLNEQQRAAVEYCDGPQLVIAGAGSGKTRVLTYKIVHLLHNGLPPYRIMALTFTNKAAREMRERITLLVGKELASQLWMGTFHSIFGRILRMNAERIGFSHDYTIYDTSDSRSLIKLIISEMNLEEKTYKIPSVQAQISNAKNALFSPDDYERHAGMRQADSDAGRPLIYLIYRTYCERCRVAGAMDFDDLLYYTNVLLRDNPDLLERYQDMFQYILVDEYQDTNFAQHLIVMQLSQKHNRISVVGDDAQSIYSFRGANISNILELNRSFPSLKTFKLEQNYRSTRSITQTANILIAANKRQIPKQIYSTKEQGSPIQVVRCYSDYEEAYVVANQIAAMKARQACQWSDFAVLYRTNAQSRVLEEALSNGGRRDKHGNVRDAIPYRIYGGLSFYQRKEIKDAIAYFRMSVNPDDDEALRRIINRPTRGIGDTTVGKVQHCAIENGVSMWHALNHPDEVQLSVNRGTLSKLQHFVVLIEKFIELNRKGTDAYEVARTIIEDTKLLSELMGDMTPENISKQENLTELVNGVYNFVEIKKEEGNENMLMRDFLAEVSLLTDQDTGDDNDNKVTLMTVHAAKGLEFKNVFIVGLEEELFPSSMSLGTMEGIEEERRLFYVAITRAMTNCVITYATSRYRNGQTMSCVASRFLRDIDSANLQCNTSSMAQTVENDFSKIRESFWPTTSERTSPNLTRPASTQSVPSSITPRGAKSEATKATSSNMQKHTVSELTAGMVILHDKFGQGTISSVDDSGADAKIKVNFDSLGVKTLMLNFAKFSILS